MKNLLNLSFALAIFTALFLTSCSNSSNNAQLGAQLTEVNTADGTSRTLAVATSAVQKITAEEYNSYKILGSFKKGKVAMDFADIAALQNENVSLVVLYEAGSAWAKNFQTGDYSKTGDDILNGLMSSYGLAITKHFDLDEFNEGIVLDSGSGKVANPVEAAREISMVDGVLMVEVKVAPKTEVKGETVSTDK